MTDPAPQETPTPDEIRNAVEADFQQYFTDSLTPHRGYATPIDNVKALIERSRNALAAELATAKQHAERSLDAQGKAESGLFEAGLQIRSLQSRAETAEEHLLKKEAEADTLAARVAELEAELTFHNHKVQADHNAGYSGMAQGGCQCTTCFLVYNWIAELEAQVKRLEAALAKSQSDSAAVFHQMNSDALEQEAKVRGLQEALSRSEDLVKRLEGERDALRQHSGGLADTLHQLRTQQAADADWLTRLRDQVEVVTAERDEKERLLRLAGFYGTNGDDVRELEQLRKDKELADKRLTFLLSFAKAPNWERDWPMSYKIEVYLNASNHDGERPTAIEALDAAMHDGKGQA